MHNKLFIACSASALVYISLILSILLKFLKAERIH